MKRLKPHNMLPGYIFERRFKNGHLVCFDAPKAGIEAIGRWVLVFIDQDDNRLTVWPSLNSLAKARARSKELLALPGDLPEYSHDH